MKSLTIELDNSEYRILRGKAYGQIRTPENLARYLIAKELGLTSDEPSVGMTQGQDDERETELPATIIQVGHRKGYGDKLVADIPTLPGTPPIGIGESEWEAIATLLWGVMVDFKTWGKHLSFDEGMKIVRVDEEP